MTSWKLAAAVAAALVAATGSAGVGAAESKRLTVSPAVSDSVLLLASLKQQYGDQLVAVGRVDRVNGSEGFALLGNVVAGTAVAGLNVGDYVAVLGQPAVAGYLLAERVVLLSAEYVPGASRVLIKAVIDSVDTSIARATVAGLSVDYATTLSSSAQIAIAGGSVVEVSGIQPVASGVMLADEVLEITSSTGSYGSLGTGRTDGSLGTGRTAGSLGTGRTDGSLGTGRTAGSLGTGRTDGSLGTGR
jgi:hypothetical protein